MTHIAQRKPPFVSTAQVTVTTLEIANLLGKPHQDVLLDAEACIKETEQHLEKDPVNGYALDLALTLHLASGYSVPIRMKIVKQWLAISDANAQFRADIQTLSTSADREASWTAALRLAQKQLLGATNQRALKAIRSALENGSHPGSSPASIATATLEFYNKNAAKLQKLETPDASTTLSMLKAFDLASDSPAKRLSRGQTEAQAWS